MQTVVLAIRNAEFAQGQIFDRTAIPHMPPVLWPMAYPWARVAEVGAQRGLRLATADQFDGAEEALIISYDWPPMVDELFARGGQAAILTSWEPPTIAWWLYSNLPRLSAKFGATVMFEGARGQVAAGQRFEALQFPVEPPSESPPNLPWRDRGWLVMVNSNKALPNPLDPRRWFDRPREVQARKILAGLSYPAVRKDQYHERLQVMAHFADRPNFDLFGNGFSQRHPAIPPRLHERILRGYRGTTGDKISLLASYQYCLAIENTRFPGYVSEKLLECLFAGCVPLYLGAPDVTRLVPDDCFIDLARFGTLSEAERFVQEQSPAEWLRKRQAGQDFLRSVAFRPFTATAFAEQILRLLD